MKKVIMMMFDGCPYCAKATKWIRELKEENPAYAPIAVEEVDENLYPDYAGEKKLSYYYVPTFYLCDAQDEPVEKVFEGAPQKEDIRKVLEAAAATQPPEEESPKEDKAMAVSLPEPQDVEKAAEGEGLVDTALRIFGSHINPVFSATNKLSGAVRRALGSEEEEDVSDIADFGDIISVERVGFSHYAVYVGKNQVIHYDMDPHDNYKICVHLASMQEFLNGSEIYTVCNFPRIYGRPTDEVSFNDFSLLFQDSEKARIMWDTLKGTTYRLYTPYETVSRARERLGETQYNLFTNNCEHFAIWCKTGLSESAQIEIVLGALYATAHNIKESLREGLEAADELAADVAENLKRKIEEHKQEMQNQNVK